MTTDSKLLFQISNSVFNRLKELDNSLSQEQKNDPKFLELYNIYVSILERSPKYLVKNNRNIPFFYYNYGMVLYYLNKDKQNSNEIRENAIRLIKTAIERTPVPNNFEFVKELIKILKDEGKYTETINFCNYILNFEPKNKDYLILIAQLYYKMNRINDSINFYEKVTAVDSYDSNIYTVLGKLYLSLKQYDKSLKLFLRAKDLDGKNPDNYKYIGKIYLLNNRKAIAGSNFKKAIGLKIYNFEQYEIDVKTKNKNINPSNNRRNTQIFLFDMYINLILCNEDYNKELAKVERDIASHGYLSQDRINIIKKKYGVL